jgi:6-phosphofructokinase
MNLISANLVQARRLDMLFVLGGNGTHAGANAIHAEVFKSFPPCIRTSYIKFIDYNKNIFASLKQSSLDRGVRG